MKSALVAGGAGFIGSHLCNSLLLDNLKVFCVDNFITGDKKNVEELNKNDNFKLITFDVSSEGLESQIEKIDYIFHLASPASPSKDNPKSYIHKPIETLLVNSLGTQNLLKIAKKDGARFLFASSSEVYGDPEVSPQKEDYFGNVNPTGLRSVYDEGKRFGEAITMAYMKTNNVDVRIARIFNTYGPKMPDDGRVIFNFIKQSLSNESVTVYGDGSQTRSLCFVSDMVDALKKMMFNEVRGEVINLGNPTELTVLEIADKILKITGSKSEISYEPLPEDDPKRRKPDISKAKKLLDWDPKVSVDEGLEKTIEYFR